MDAVVAASTVLFGVPLMLVADPVSTIEAPSTSSGDAFRNVKSAPVTLRKASSDEALVMAPSG
ncbi:MAG TPA: hypothetical protein VFE41_25275 [Acetobacteraceae bacterium]|nr:hypothetical protein [Acetobacteraceae bacterium]